MQRFKTLVLLIAFSLAACASPASDFAPELESEAATPYPPVVATLPPALPEATPYPEPPSPSTAFTVQDALGREVRFAAPPRRIVIAGRALFMLANAAYIFPGAGERIVALGQTGQGSGNFLALYEPQYQQKATLTGDAGAEQIAAYQPDLVLLKSYLAENLGKPIETLGIPVVYLDLETPEQYWRDLTTLGQIFGQSERAAQIVAYYQRKVERVQQTVQGVAKPRVLILQYSEKDGKVAFNVPPQSWMQTLMTEIAGGEPLWKQIELGKGWTQVSFEQIAAWDADKIFVISYFRNVSEVVAQLKQDAQWEALRAVREGNLYGFAGDLYSWDQPDVRWILGLSWLAARMHPELFPDYDAVQEVKEFYQTLYGLDETFVNEKIIPSFTGDLP
ncbi:MAG: ABC transporter substrate-binding protein [Anaerolineales bacterium]|nr:ABC transporter substrate-binding protein [Anaerolineales bacterium]MCS7247829.1 ABC transporter substrate-binding protein [Anaerolineales bacterium]MDW8161639.1 ABC transporter substrate-binding protein [Anaerolineales bacterium]MDW8447866.1 ABC transporter substrate-binding protein [Anaerolineales bacterium]